MSGDTKCHLGKQDLGCACPNGEDFSVKNLDIHGGKTFCTNPSCPFQLVNDSNNRVQVVLVGPEGNGHAIQLRTN